ncbi:MAG: hypothetical protein ACYSYV_09055 [Planctomycetota bacterium]|jgi:hypothetical protein
MFQTILFIALGGIVGTAGSIVLRLLLKDLPPEAHLATAAFLGALCSSVFVCRARAIQGKIEKISKDKRKGPVAKLTTVLGWLLLVAGLAAIVIVSLKICGRL